jgi:hypothetical protein
MPSLLVLVSRYGRSSNNAHHFGGIDRPPSRVTICGTHGVSSTSALPISDRDDFCEPSHLGAILQGGMKTTAIDVLTMPLRDIETAERFGMSERAIYAHLNGTRKIRLQLFLFIKALDELWKLKEGRR